ncbi:MAG: hypothetical protein COA97_07020 [Flavobacteriales bacterium]|nr:MAG: hypothetical protein COA97_07020 [Flavobacteriales bacterium]
MNIRIRFHKTIIAHLSLIAIFFFLGTNGNAQYWEKDLPKGGGFHFETANNEFFNVLSETTGSTTTFTICQITLYGDSIRSFTAMDTNFAVSTSLIEQLSDSSFIVAGKTGNYAYVSRIDYNGNLLWYDTLLARSPSSYKDIAMINNSEFILVGVNGDWWSTPYGLAVKYNINGTRGWVNQSGYQKEHLQIEKWTDSTFIMMSGWNTGIFEEIDTAGIITPLFNSGAHPTRGGFTNNNGEIVIRGEYYFSLRSAAAALRKTSDGAGTLDFNLDWATSPSTESYLSHHDNSFDSTEYIMVGNLHTFNGATNGWLGAFLNGFFVKMDTNGVIDYTKNYPGNLKWCREVTSGCYLIHSDNKLIMDCCGGDTIPVAADPNIFICIGDSAIIYGTFQSTAGTYSNTLSAFDGCDSLILTTNLAVNSSFSYNQNDTICQGDSILIYGTYQSVQGIYFDSLQTIQGCDSIYTTTLTINPISTQFDTTNLCSGDSLFVGGSFQTIAGTYYDTLTAVNTCDSIITTTLSFTGSPTNVISGTIYYQGIPITSGEVKLILKTGNSPQTMIVTDSMAVNSNGTYVFNGLSAGNYLIKAKGDTTLYVNVSTYADSTNHWQWANQYTIGATCFDTTSGINVYLIDFPTTIGFGRINGNVMNGANNNPFPNVDISLEKLPTGIVQGGDITDINGDFNMMNIETGNYMLNVDVAGYKMDTVTFFDFTTQNNVTYDIDICLDLNNDTITYCSIVVTSIKNIDFNKMFNIYPNPTSGKFMLIKLSEIKETISLKLFDATSKLIIEKIIPPDKKEIEIDISKYSKGLYTLQLNMANGKKIAKKILKK